MLSKPGDLVRIPKHQRLEILRRYADKLASMPDLSLICVVVDKDNKPATYDVFDAAWKALIQRFENTLAHRNFPGPRNPDDMGMLFPDRSDEKKLNALLRRMRAFNPVPSQQSSGYRNLQIRTIIEDPNYRDSSHSYFIQSVDVTAFLLYQHLAPSAYMKKKSGQNYFGRLASIVCKHASPRDPLHIVRLLKRGPCGPRWNPNDQTSQGSDPMCIIPAGYHLGNPWCLSRVELPASNCHRVGGRR